jgi:hypothetical protein
MIVRINQAGKDDAIGFDDWRSRRHYDIGADGLNGSGTDQDRSMWDDAVGRDESTGKCIRMLLRV